MNMKKIFYTLVLATLVLTGCDKFLDKMPDNRAEIDTPEKIRALLVSAYPSTDYMLVTEFMSDNVDDYGKNNPNTDRFIDQVFAWDDVTESDNEDPESVWGSCYGAVACANEALKAIDLLTEQDPTLDLRAERAEALPCLWSLYPGERFLHGVQLGYQYQRCRHSVHHRSGNDPEARL